MGSVCCFFRRRAICAVVFFGIQSTICLSQSEPAVTHYDWYPETKLDLGHGLSPENLYLPFVDCINYQIQVPLGNDPNVAQSTDVKATLVANTRDLKSSLHVDYRAKASFFGIGSSDLSANVSLDDSSDSQDVALVVTATSYFPQMEVINASLKPEYSRLLNSVNPSDFATFSSQCGKEYVKSVDRLVSISVIITFRQQSSTTVSQVRGSGSGGLNLGVVSGDVQADLNKETSEINSHRQADMQIYARGAGTADFADTVKQVVISSSSVDVTAIGEAIRGVLSKLTTPVIGGYEVRPMQDFVSTAPDNVFTQAKWAAAEAIAERFQKVRDADAGISAILLKTDLRSRLTTPDQMAQLRVQQSLFAPYEQALQDQYHACLEGTDVSNCTIPTAGAPDLSIVPLVFFTGNLDLAIPPYTSKGLQQQFYGIAGMWPGTQGPQEWRVGIDNSNSGSSDPDPLFSIERIDVVPPSVVDPQSKILPFYSFIPDAQAVYPGDGFVCVVSMKYKDPSQPYLGFDFESLTPMRGCPQGDSFRYHDVYGDVWEAIILRESSTSLGFAKRRVPSVPELHNFVATQMRLRPDSDDVANILEKLETQDRHKFVGRCRWVDHSGKSNCNKISSTTCSELHGQWDAAASCEDAVKRGKSHLNWSREAVCQQSQYRCQTIEQKLEHFSLLLTTEL